MYCMRYIVYETKLSNDESLACVSLLRRMIRDYDGAIWVIFMYTNTGLKFKLLFEN